MIDNQELTSKELDAHKGDDLRDKTQSLLIDAEFYISNYDLPETTNEAVRLIDRFVEQLTASQQKLDVAVEALEDIRAYALANEGDIDRAQTAAQMITTLKASTQAALNIIGNKS